MIKIHYDFTDGTEISYIEGIEKIESKEDFNTNCLDFFQFDIDVDNVIVIKKDGSYIDRNELLNNNIYCSKHIRLEHNLQKLLKANTFEFKK